MKKEHETERIVNVFSPGNCINPLQVKQPTTTLINGLQGCMKHDAEDTKDPEPDFYNFSSPHACFGRIARLTAILGSLQK